jgi:hypothetical protein
MDPLTKTALTATLHCLTGCAIGEVLGMVVGTTLGLHDAWTIILAIVLAFVFGYGLTMLPLLRSGMAAKKAIKVALASDTVSIASMEVVDNAIIVLIPGAMAATLASGLFWGSLLVALLVAFVVTVPINRFLIARGMGHAHVHSHHDHHH